MKSKKKKWNALCADSSAHLPLTQYQRWNHSSYFHETVYRSSLQATVKGAWVSWCCKSHNLLKGI